MKQTSKRFTSMLIALLLVVVAFVVFFDLIQPAYGDLLSLKANEASVQSSLDEATANVSQVKQLVSQYANSTSTESPLAAAMPAGPDIAGALAQIYGIASANSLSVQSIGVSTPAAQLKDRSANAVLKPRGTITLQLEMSGSYESLKAFLAALETNLRVFDVNSLELQSTNTSGKNATADVFSFHLAVTTYYQTQ